MAILDLRLRPSVPALLALALVAITLLPSARAQGAECAPTLEVSEALANAEAVASEELGADEAEELLRRLTEKGVVIGGEVCFLTEDFAEFGHIVAEFFAHHLKVSSRAKGQWKPSFSKKKRDDSVARSNCGCSSCPKKHYAWCSSKKPKPACCPHYCSSIFSAISVGALSGLKISGIDACCEESAKKCKSPKSGRRRHASRRSGASKSSSSKKSPHFNFSSGSKSKRRGGGVVFGVDESDAFSEPVGEEAENTPSMPEQEEESDDKLQTPPSNMSPPYVSTITPSPEAEFFQSPTDSGASSSAVTAEEAATVGVQQDVLLSDPTVTPQAVMSESNSEWQSSPQKGDITSWEQPSPPSPQPSTGFSANAESQDQLPVNPAETSEETPLPSALQSTDATTAVENAHTPSASELPPVEPSTSLGTPVEAVDVVDTEVLPGADVAEPPDTAEDEQSGGRPAWLPRSSSEESAMAPLISPSTSPSVSVGPVAPQPSPSPQAQSDDEVKTEQVDSSIEIAGLQTTTLPDIVED